MPSKVYYSTPDGLKICAFLHHTPDAKGSIVLAHGIMMDKDMDGGFVRLAETLQQQGYNVLRFDFRGHGESDGQQEDMTICGEIHDLAASVTYAQHLWNLPVGIVAASFGAVAAVEYVAKNPVHSLVLWNPVLDLDKTFLHPIVPWAKKSFNDEGFAHLAQYGYLWLSQKFKIGQNLVDEIRTLRPFEAMPYIEAPLLTLHGDADTYVPHEVSLAHALYHTENRFITIPNAEHGFDAPDDEALVIQETVDWLARWMH